MKFPLDFSNLMGTLQWTARVDALVYICAIFVPNLSLLLLFLLHLPLFFSYHKCTKHIRNIRNADLKMSINANVSVRNSNFQGTNIFFWFQFDFRRKKQREKKNYNDEVETRALYMITNHVIC